MGIAPAHLAPPSLVVADGQEDLPSLPVLCAHSFILGLQGPNLLSLMEFELNPSQVVPSSSLIPWKMPAQPLGPVHSNCPGPAPGWGVFTAVLIQVMRLSGIVTWQEPSPSYFLQADEDGIFLAW